MYKAEEKERILKKVLEAYSMYQGVRIFVNGISHCRNTKATASDMF